MASLRKRRKSRGRLYLALAIVVVVAGALIGFSVLRSSPGTSSATNSSSPSSSTPQDTVTLSNATLTDQPSIEDGQVGLGVSAYILNNAAVKVQNTTMYVNGVSLGACVTDTIQPQQQILCKAGNSIPCTVMPTAAPYTIKAEVEFSDGTTYSTSIVINTTLSATYC